MDEGDDQRKPDEPGIDDVPHGDDVGGHGSSRLGRFTRRLLDRGDDVRELASTVLETSDRAKSEMVKMVAREVRNYLQELKLKEDFIKLARSHSLELKMSVHLKPLADAVDREEPPPEEPESE